jgi:hypothetical protein
MEGQRQEDGLELKQNVATTQHVAKNGDGDGDGAIAMIS